MWRMDEPRGLKTTAAAAFLILTCLSLAGGAAAQAAPVVHQESAERQRPGERLMAPAEGQIPVAVVLSRGADVIDFAGPWEVFQDASVPGRGRTAADTRPFQLFTVAASREPIEVSGGLRITPDYAFGTAPPAKVIIVPAQAGADSVMLAWLRSAHEQADITMSVCTGAFILASAGLLDGHSATTHHESLNRFEQSFPKVQVRRDVRYVEGPRIATAAGLTSGIDLALRVVERYFGSEVARRTAEFMEHESKAWNASAGYWDAGDAQRRDATALPAVPVAALRGNDPVLLADGREVPGVESRTETYGEYRYLFSTEQTRARFLANPEAFSIQLQGACAFMATSGAPPGSGDPARYYVHDRKIYIFASENCRESFKAAPERYLPTPGTPAGR